MDKSSELKRILGEVFALNKCRLDCFAKILLALIAVRTVNLREIAVALDDKTKIDSRYMRLKRFFAHCKIDSNIFAKWIFKLFFKTGKKVYVTVDRTNWFFGKAKINILTLGVAYEGIAIPLFWNLLNKAGNATAKEHTEIVERFIEIFGVECIAGVLADREFMSGNFIGFLNKNKIPFYIRIKDNCVVKIKGKKFVEVKKLFSYLNARQKGIFGMDVEIFDQKVFLSGSRSETGELMIVATNRNPKNAVAIYLRRWEIECFFQSLKGRGFRFEDTHMTNLKKLEQLMFVLAIGFCWMHKVGEWRAIKIPIVLNKYRDSMRPQYSYFRYGFDFVRDIIMHIYRSLCKFNQCVSQLIMPNYQQLGDVL